MGFIKNLNSGALEDLYKACLNAKGIYDAVKMSGLDKQLPGFDGCLEDLNRAITKAEAAEQTAIEYEDILPHADYVVKVICGDCGKTLVESVEMGGDELKQSWSRLVMIKGFNTGRCPNKCSPTYADFNINTEMKIYEAEKI